VLFLLNTSFEKATDAPMQDQFAENFPETPAHHRIAVRRLIEKFCETGSVLDAERSGRPSKLNDKKLMDISDTMLRLHQNHCTSWCMRNISGLQQRTQLSDKN
jgi:transposase